MEKLRIVCEVGSLNWSLKKIQCIVSEAKKHSCHSDTSLALKNFLLCVIYKEFAEIARQKNISPFSMRF